MTTPDQTADRTRDVADAAEYRTLLGKYVDHCEPGGSIQLHEDIAQKIASLLARLAEEIETLRQRIADLMGDDESLPRYTTKRLRQEIERQTFEAKALVKAAEAALTAAQAENARLREALKPFTFPAAPEAFGSDDGGCTSALICDEDVQRARALSADKPAGGGELGTQAPSWLIDALKRHPLGTSYAIEHDGFHGPVIGYYLTLEGKPGVVMQIAGARIVHVYGEKWLKPAEPAPAPDARKELRP